VPLEKGSGGKGVTCKICGQETSKGNFCSRHLKAHKCLVDRFDAWEKALKISWKGYLSQIVENSSAGDWVKEVAEYLIENEDT
jgi:chemotaxis regulatin CheY-phosphate phosphatase CheZ